MPIMSPPFRADHVGSILRTAPLKKAREQKAKGEISADQLKAVEDEEIRKIIKKQEEVGLKAITDGVVLWPSAFSITLATCGAHREPG